MTEHIKACFPKLLKVSLTVLYFGIYSNEYKGLILLVLLECCSIFKVLPAGSLADSFVIISSPPFYVNTFFESFPPLPHPHPCVLYICTIVLCKKYNLYYLFFTSLCILLLLIILPFIK